MKEKKERPKESRVPSLWDPFQDLEAWSPFGSRLAQLFGEPALERFRTGAVVAPVDITEDEEGFSITAEIPGVKKDDLTLELNEGVLSIRGEKRSEREEKKDRGRLLERSYGSFSRSFRLPTNVDGDRVEAQFKDGVLKVRLHKTAESKPRTISVKS